jgi:transposase
LKAQAIVDKLTGQIICTNFSKGSVHDFKLFQKSKLKIKSKTVILADSGYQGIQKIHKMAEIPKKKSKNKPLTKEIKKQNRELSQKRTKIENVFACLKRFKVFSTKYRNRRKRFGLRFNLFAAIFNMDNK